jgi:VanZ family protein
MKVICDQQHSSVIEHIYSPFKNQDSPHNSKHLFDIYSLTHIFWCMALSLMSFTFLRLSSKQIWVITVILSIMFEIHENSPPQIEKYIRIEVNSQGRSSYRGDTYINLIGDIISNMIGVYLALNLSIHSVIMILFGLFIRITQVLGVKYWTEMFQFVFM